MKKIFAAIILMMLAVTMVIPCYADNTNWVEGMTPAELTNKITSVNVWECSKTPDFCQDYLIPIINPATETLYVLTETYLYFTPYRTISARFVYYPAKNVTVYDGDLRDVTLTTPTDDKRIIDVDSLTIDDKEYRWTTSTDGCIVLCYENENKEFTYVYIYEMIGGRKDKLTLTDIFNGNTFSMKPVT